MPSESINTGALFPGGSIVEYTITNPVTGKIFPYPKFTADLINSTWRQASIAANAMDAKFSALESWLPTGTPTDIISGASESQPVVEPPVDIPSSVNATDVMSLFDTKYQELVAMLVAKFTEFQETYFPNDSEAYAAVETWVQEALDNPNAGLPAAVAAQMMTDAKDKITADAARASDAVIQTFAARRFPLPPGAAASAVLQIQQKAQDGVAEAGRKITTNSIEMMKFAVEKCIGMRQLALNSAVEYIKALASGPDMASRLVGIGYDAQSKLISAASSFYGVRKEVAQLATQNNQFNVTSALQAAEKNQGKEMALIEDRLKALLTEAQSIAQMSTSLFNNLHASTSVSSSDSVSTAV